MNPSENPKINPAEYRSIAALSSLFSLRMLGLFMILPVFALYAQGLSGVTPTKVGLALGIYGLTQASFQVPFGYISDRFGRKPVIMIGLLLFCIGSIMAAMSQSIHGIIWGRSLQGAGAIGSVTLALLADLTRSEIRLRAMAIVGVTIALSFGLAFILGPLLTAQWGVPGIFWLSAVLGIFGMAVTVFFVPRPKMGPPNVLETLRVEFFDTTKKSVLPTFSGLSTFKLPSWLSFELCSLYFGTLVIHASLTALFLKIPGMIHTLHFSEGDTWQFYLPVFLFSLVATIPVILFLERNSSLGQSSKNLIIVSVLVLSELFLVISHQTLFGLATSLWLFFIAFNVLEASLPASISKAAPENQRGTVLGIFSTMQFLGLFLGGFLGGILDSMGGYIAVLSFCVILALIWLVSIISIFWCNRARAC